MMILLSSLLFLCAAFSSARAAPLRPPAPLTQKGIGLTQENTSGLSQNMMGRTATITNTNTNTATDVDPNNPVANYPGLMAPQTPRVLTVGPRAENPPPPPVRLDQPQAPQTTGVGAPGAPPAPPANAIPGSGSAMPEAPSNE